MPKGFTDKVTANPLFPKPLATFKQDGVGFSATAVRGKNWLRSVVNYTLTQLCHFPGHFTNHQLRAAMISALIESGCTDEQVALRSGHRDSNSLKNYHSQSNNMKREQTLSLLDTLEEKESIIMKI